MPEETGVGSSPTDGRPSPPSVTPSEWQADFGPIAGRLVALGGTEAHWAVIVSNYWVEHEAAVVGLTDVEVALRRWWAVDARWCRDRVEDREDETTSPLWTSSSQRSIGAHQGMWVREALIELLAKGWLLSRILVAALCVLEGP